tara:strand:+ start:361 stop:579 length:219 start_codon:yes stop_codon:yes gene_type:complete
MSNPFSEEHKERIFEEVCEELALENPNLSNEQIEDLAEPIAKERLDDEYYFTSQGHPSLSAADRNPSLINRS